MASANCVYNAAARRLSITAAVRVLMEWSVEDPVPALNAPPVSRPLQQGIWGRSQAGENEVFGIEWLAAADSCGDDFNDPACAKPCLTDMLGLRHRFLEDGATQPGTYSVTGCSTDRPHPSRSTDLPGDNHRESFRPTEGEGGLQGSACATAESSVLSSFPLASIREEGRQAVAGVGDLATVHWASDAAHPVVGCHELRPGLPADRLQSCLIVIAR
jgi:hypothetical protein